MVLSVEVTGSEVADGTVVPEVMAGVKGRVRQVIADGGYDWRKVYEALMKHRAGVKIVIPPRKGQRGGVEGHPRDENLRYIRRRGRKPMGRSDGLWTASADGKLLLSYETDIWGKFAGSSAR